MTRRCLNRLVDPQKEETIFWVSFIEISEVDVDPPLAILLLYKGGIGEPAGVEGLSDEAGLQ